MGADKALLMVNGRAMIQQIAAEISQITGAVSVVGSRAKYANFGYPVVEDIFPGLGPLAGIHAALASSRAEWNLVVACDMPDIKAEFLLELIERAEASPADAVLPAGTTGRPEPLCAAYRRTCLPVVERALRKDVRKVTDGLDGLQADFWRVPDRAWFHNLNTPEDWASYSNSNG